MVIFNKNARRLASLRAFFVASLFVARALGADCTPTGSGQSVTVQRVYDGDTLTLGDGRRVRLLGVNTPELGRGGAPDEAFAREAKQAVEQFLVSADNLKLYFDTEYRDRHGRYLAHLATISSAHVSASLGQVLLAKGLAYHVVVPPNMQLARCFAGVENEARRARLGLWGASDSPPSNINPVKSSAVRHASAVRHGGYQRVTARVRRVLVSSGKAWWINLDSNVTGVIYPEHQSYFDATAVRAWQGHWLEVEGWVYEARYRGKSQWRVKLETPYAVTLNPGSGQDSLP